MAESRWIGCPRAWPAARRAHPQEKVSKHSVEQILSKARCKANCPLNQCQQGKRGFS